MQMSTYKTANFRWFLKVYYVPELSSLLVAKGAKLIGPRVGPMVSNNRKRKHSIVARFLTGNYSLTKGNTGKNMKTLAWSPSRNVGPDPNASRAL